MKMKKSIWKHEQQTVEIPEDNDNMNIDEPELDRHSTKSKTR
ncbi:7066_t:CDS:2 [Entrophospora sp. SA101]|nr:7066_t:CDS:2 [Entrophospora sp. SA101]